MGILLQIANKIAQMDLLLVIMEDMRLTGNTDCTLNIWKCMMH
jgi:hypothetical protein